MVDALSSGGSIRKVVLVRIQSRAQITLTLRVGAFNFELFLDSKSADKSIVLQIPE